MSPVANLGMRDAVWQVFLKSVCASAAQTRSRQRSIPLGWYIQKSIIWLLNSICISGKI